MPKLFYVTITRCRSDVGTPESIGQQSSPGGRTAGRGGCFTYVRGLGRHLVASRAVKQQEMSTCPTLSGAIWSARRMRRTTRHEHWWGQSESGTKRPPEHLVQTNISSFPTLKHTIVGGTFHVAFVLWSDANDLRESHKSFIVLGNRRLVIVNSVHSRVHIHSTKSSENEKYIPKNWTTHVTWSLFPRSQLRHHWSSENFCFKSVLYLVTYLLTQRS